ncbi:MAG: hypothetical protein F4Y15_13800 [Acidimicrobiales bacterium]|nr:hypothetical protein [Acidimicrobiales bacterium]
MRSSAPTPLRSARWLQIGAALGAALVLFLAQFAVFVGLGSPVQARGSDNQKAVKIDITFTGNFVQDALASGETLPTDTTFASVAFATHESTVSYFNAGEAASAGLKAFAETGSTELLVEEFAAQTNGANVYPKKNGGTFPQGATAVQTFESLRASRGQDHLTFVASLSESPDWFVGARNIDLRPGGVWISELEVDLFAWDAGTDSGTDWDSADSATDPPADIAALTGAGKFSDEPIAKLTISMLPPPSNESRQRVLRADANPLDGALNVFWDAHHPPFRMVRSTLHTVEFDRYLIAWKSGDEEFQTDLDGDRVKVVMGRSSNHTMIEGLTNGTEYTVRVTHANAVGPAAHHSSPSAATPNARDGVLVSTFSQGLGHTNGVAMNLITNLKGAKYVYNRFTTGPSAATLGSVTFARIQPSHYTSSRSAPKLELHLLEDLPGGEIGDFAFTQPGQPGALIGTFVSPPEYLDGPTKFVAPGGGFALTASTDYWLKLVLVQGSVNIPMAMIGGPDPPNVLDPDSQPGWDIANACQWSLFDIWNTQHVKMCSYYSNFMVSLNGPISSTVPLASISGGSAIEGESIEFTVELSSAPSAQATVKYDTVDGSTPLAATTADNDYTAVSGGTVTFAQGETSKTISIATGDDTTDEHNERFIVRLSSPSPNIALSEIDSAAGMIIDDDQTASSDSTLAGITLTDQDGNTIALNETFDPLRFVYTADAGASVESMHLSVSFAEGINPGHIRYFDKFGKVAEGKKSTASSAEFTRIMPGVNLLKALITSKDHRRESLYKVMVNKAASSDASIATLVLQDDDFNDFVLSPAFSPSVTEYTATAENNQPFYVDVGLNHSGADAEVSVNGEVVVSYGLEYPYGIFDMPAGDNTLAIEVTAEDGTVQTYTFTIERAGGDVPAAPPRPAIESVSHDSVTIAWNDPGDSTITGYQVLRHNPAIHDPGVFAVIENDTGSSATSYEDTTVAPETTYVYRVKARNAYGLSGKSPDRSVTTPAEPPPPNTAATGSPTIAGTPQVGETLAADTSGISDANGLTSVQYAYQWIRSDGNADTNIPGATGQTHILTDDDEGKTIKVSVSFTDDDGYPESLTSAATAAVEAIPVDPVDPVEPVEPVDPVDPVDPLWSGEMTVADYGNASLGAYNDDTLFSNITGTAQLEIRWLWYLESERKLYLAFKAPVAGARDWTLHIDELALSFPSGDSNFVFRNVDLSWTAGQVVNVRISR